MELGRADGGTSEILSFVQAVPSGRHGEKAAKDDCVVSGMGP